MQLKKAVELVDMYYGLQKYVIRKELKMASWIICILLLTTGLDKNVDALVIASGLFAIAGNIAMHK